MKTTALQIRPGNVVERDGRHCLVLKTTILQPGKGGAFVQAELRELSSGAKLNHRWRTQENVERVRVEERPCTFLYGDGDRLTFMDSDSYEQYEIDRSLAGDGASLLQEGMAVALNFIGGTAASVKLPATVTATVTECEPVIKGQTAASSFKPAMLDNGVRIMAPPHIAVGDRVVINSADLSYVEKARSS